MHYFCSTPDLTPSTLPGKAQSTPPKPRLWILVAIVLSLQIPTSYGQASLAIQNVTVIDVLKGEALPNRTIIIEGDKITQVGMSSQLSAPAGARIIQGEGHFLLPGFWDSHVHWLDPTSFGPLMIANGVTCVREMGNATEYVVGIRSKLNSKQVVGPEMLITGAIVDGNPPVWPFSEAVSNAKEARAAVKKLAGAGVDFIKVYSRLSKEAWLAAIDEANQQGLPTIGHIPRAVTVDDAMASDQITAEHLSQFGNAVAKFASPEVGGSKQSDLSAWRHWPKVRRDELLPWLRRLAKSGLAQCPTLVVIEGIGKTADKSSEASVPNLKYASPLLRNMWAMGQYGRIASTMRANLPHMKALVGLMHECGVPLLIGTDVANPNIVPGFSLHDEMRHFQEAGIPPADILRAAITTPAKLFKRNSSLGSIEPGKSASLVLLRKNPLKDIRHTSTIAATCNRGTWYDRAALDALLAKVAGAGKDTATSGSDIGAHKPQLPPLPGKLVDRAEYETRVMNMVVGTEHLEQSVEDSGISHLRVTSKPKGGPYRPSVSTVSTNEAGIVVNASYQHLDLAGKPGPILATYTRHSGRVEATAQIDGKTENQSLSLPESGSLTGPTFSGGLFALRRLKLGAGESVTRQNSTFGMPTWKLTSSPITWERLPDQDLKRNGKPTSCRRFRATLKFGDGQSSAQTLWLDAKGHLLKVRTPSAFGTLQTLRK